MSEYLTKKGWMIISLGIYMARIKRVGYFVQKNNKNKEIEVPKTMQHQKILSPLFVSLDLCSPSVHSLLSLSLSLSLSVVFCFVGLSAHFASWGFFSFLWVASLSSTFWRAFAFFPV